MKFFGFLIFSMRGDPLEDFLKHRLLCPRYSLQGCKFLLLTVLGDADATRPHFENGWLRDFPRQLLNGDLPLRSEACWGCHGSWNVIRNPLQKALKHGSQDGDSRKWKRQAHLPGMQLLRCKTFFRHSAALRLVPQGRIGPIKASQELTDYICIQSVRIPKSSIKFSSHTWIQDQLNNLTSKIIKYLNFSPFYQSGSSYSSNKETF